MAIQGSVLSGTSRVCGERVSTFTLQTVKEYKPRVGIAEKQDSLVDLVNDGL